MMAGEAQECTLSIVPAMYHSHTPDLKLSLQDSRCDWGISSVVYGQGRFQYSTAGGCFGVLLVDVVTGISRGLK